MIKKLKNALREAQRYALLIKKGKKKLLPVWLSDKPEQKQCELEELLQAVEMRAKAKREAISGTQQELADLARDKTSIGTGGKEV